MNRYMKKHWDVFIGALSIEEYIEVLLSKVALFRLKDYEQV